MYLVFDIGGTNTRIAVSDDGQVLAEVKTIPTDQDFKQAIQSISRVAEEITQGKKIAAVAVGVAGALDKDKNLLIKSPHITGWVQRPLKEELERIFDCPLYLENDAHLGGLGEATFGTGKNSQIVAFITIGTGVGGVRIVNKTIDRSSQGFEPGHQIIIPDGNPCDCGGRGHLETYIAGSYLKQLINWDEVAKYLAIGLNNTIVHWSPEIVVLGGSVMKSIPLGKVRAYLKEYLTIFPQAPEIALSTLDDQAGLYGGLHYLKG